MHPEQAVTICYFRTFNSAPHFGHIQPAVCKHRVPTRGGHELLLHLNPPAIHPGVTGSVAGSGVLLPVARFAFQGQGKGFGIDHYNRLAQGNTLHFLGLHVTNEVQLAAGILQGDGSELAIHAFDSAHSAYDAGAANTRLGRAPL